MKKIIILMALVLMETALFAQGFKLETYNDTNNGGNSTITVGEITETIGGKTVTVWILSGTLVKTINYPFAGCRIIPDAAVLTKFKNAKGVSFMVSGDGRKYRLKMATPGGEGNHYGEAFTAAKGNGTQINLEYKKLSQEPFWGKKKTFIQAEIEYIEVQLQVNSAVDKFEFKIWDFKPLD
jgi:hypothetical protein